MIRAILACDDNWGIGKDGDLPWPNNPADLQWFKESTTGGVVAMGKATWDSLPKKPLPNRNNIVVTSSTDDYDGGGYHYMRFEAARKELVNMNHLQNVWIIGGAKLVEGLIDIIDEVWLSRIDGAYDCDTFLNKDTIVQNFTIGNMQVDEQLTIEHWIKT